MGTLNVEELYRSLVAERLNWSWGKVLLVTALLGITAIAALLFLRAGKIKRSQAVSVFLLAAWVCAISGYCLFARPPGSRFDYELELFSSWREAVGGNWVRLIENGLNLLLLLPAGFLLPAVLDRRVSWWKGLLLGLLFSLGIEVSQYVTHRGTFDVDDILNNGLGCMFGVIAGSLWFRRKRRS